MTTTAKKLYIRRKLQELIQYAENSGLDDGREIARKIGFGLFALDESMGPVRNFKLAK